MIAARPPQKAITADAQARSERPSSHPQISGLTRDHCEPSQQR